ncbi:MAG: M3 family metallopeptidase [Dehalococcoidia bacterium]
MQADHLVIDYRTPSPDEIAQAQERTLAAAEDMVTALLAAPSNARTFATTVQPLEEIADLLGQAGGRYGFMAQVAADAAVRDAAETLRAALERYGVELAFREEIHAAVTAYAGTAEAGALTGERRRLLDRLLRDYRRDGFDLPVARRARVKEIKQRLVTIAIAFRRAIDEYDDGIELTRGQLAGLPQRYVAGLRTVERDGQRRYRVSLDYPDYFPFMDHADAEDSRRDLLVKFFRKGGRANVALLEEALALRDELARLLGYPSWATYVLDIRMAKTPDAAHAFLADLRERLAPRLAADIEELTAAKREHTGDPNATLHLWDWRYYHSHLRQRRHAIDEFAVAAYFPLDAVLDGLFEITQSLFGVRFAPVEPANAWHPDVRLYRVSDAATGDAIAHFYLDLFPRPGKYGHAAAFTLRGGRRLADGSYQRPVSAMVANFTRPAGDRPSLLRHAEVVTLFHEFGHILHQTLTTADCLRFSGTSTERDFVEAPSQMLEEWVWLPEVVERFSRHVETGAALPRPLLDAMIAARRLSIGIATCRQLSFAELDLAYHGPGDRKDSTAIAAALHPITGFPMPEGTYWQAGFGHLFGYDAGYYGYLWSKVFGADMFTRFAAEGPLNPATGVAFRRAVLEPGGSRDGEEMVRAFLGRAPSSAAFLRDLGLDA